MFSETECFHLYSGLFKASIYRTAGNCSWFKAMFKWVVNCRRNCHNLFVHIKIYVVAPNLSGSRDGTYISIHTIQCKLTIGKTLCRWIFWQAFYNSFVLYQQLQIINVWQILLFMCFVSSEVYQNFKERKMEELLPKKLATMNQNIVHI